MLKKLEVTLKDGDEIAATVISIDGEQQQDVLEFGMCVNANDEDLQGFYLDRLAAYGSSGVALFTETQREVKSVSLTIEYEASE